MGQRIYTEKEASKDIYLMISEIDRKRRNDDRTKYDLAKSVGIQQSSVTRILNHNQQPSFRTFVKLLKSIGAQIKIGEKLFL